MALKDKLVGVAGTASATTSILGGYQICHSVCIGIIGLLSIVGITVVGMPLMFLTKVAVPFWIVGIIFLSGMTLLTYTKKLHFSQNLMLANAGLLIAGTPFQTVQSFKMLLWFLGGALVVTSIILALQSRDKKKCCA